MVNIMIQIKTQSLSLDNVRSNDARKKCGQPVLIVKYWSVLIISMRTYRLVPNTVKSKVIRETKEKLVR